jgi:hypothetical protein
MSDNIKKWELTADHPEKPGWYPIAYQFDPEEGWLHDSGYWSGTEWSIGWADPSFIFMDKACEGPEEASAMALENLPD